MIHMRTRSFYILLQNRKVLFIICVLITLGIINKLTQQWNPTKKTLEKKLHDRIAIETRFNTGVREDENIAREDLDDIGNVKTKQTFDIKNDINAAIEVQSEEIKSSLKNVPLNKKTKKTDLEEGETSFHQLPAHQQDWDYGKQDFDYNKNNIEHFNFRRNHQVSGFKTENMSVLGRRLFLHQNEGFAKLNNFTISFYKYGKTVVNRLLKHYTSTYQDPYENCSVKNCKIILSDELSSDADAVIFHLHRMVGPPTDLKRKNYNQIWVWISDESPYNTFYFSKDKEITHYNGYFNWSMTYRSTSDVPVPYGRTIPLLNINKDADIDIFKKKSKLAAVLGSNCSGKNYRWDYVKELQKHIQVDTFGKCGKFLCEGRFNKDCKKINDYKFYLAFENANCREYITEKAWWNAFEKKSIPVVMGAFREDYEKLFPPNSFIFVEDFSSPKELASYLMFLSENPIEYNKYHYWRTKFKVVNEHGYFGSPVFHFCRLCEALNYNDRKHKVYNHLEDFWGSKNFCYKASWPKRNL